ncbi:hypothetical protein SAMN04488072_10354 [Lentibacillus halodurans]|uniref:Uncharacterized protein n=1 Tax=Lentibacillus halodurans TaxID=237679 RepID=A0A1I0WJ39_9BACI|nr:DUF6470 family protein [Lentibacillus halodurans]SFA88248.1 hypothetical protein SAMN04488072_10354 [Lentibacillus halodurans]
MRLPQIRMESQMAQIQIQQTSSRQEIRQPEADISIRQPHAEVSIETQPSKLTIDQTKAWEDMGLMHISRFIEKYANDGRQGVMDGIARRVKQGNGLMKIENDGNPIASQAITNAYDQQKQLGITFIPSHFAVKTNYEPADVEINVNINRPVIQNEPQKPIHTYTPGNVTTSMRQYQYLEIDVAHLPRM